MKFSRSSAVNDGVLKNSLKSERRIKQFGGKYFKNLESGPLFVVVVVVLGLVGSGLCEEFSMVSLPLGFKFFGYERNYLVSENGVFAFGFLPHSRKDDAFVIGIWYNLKVKGEEEPLAVWTVGGGIRVSENSTFMLSMDGSLTLYDSNGLLMWSSNTRNLGVQDASLLNNGNLILRGFDQNVVWESFRSPTDTLLPGQSTSFPQTLQAPSESSVSGFYSLVIRESGNVALEWDHNITYWSSNLSPSSGPKIARFDANGTFALLDASSQILWSRSSKDFRDPSVNLRHLKIDADGNLRIYSWDIAFQTWRVGWQAVENQCNVFGSCGLFSVCSYNNTGPVCDCLVKDSFHFGSPKALGSYGCKKMVDLGNCKMGTSMLVLQQTVLYGLYPPHDVDIMLSADACKRYCSNDRSCFAATAKNDGSGLCTIKRTGFISGYQYSSLSSVSFLKVCLVPQAVSAHQATKFPNDSSTPSAKQVSKGIRKGFLIPIALLFIITASVFLAMEMVVVWFLYKRRQIKSQWRVPLQKDALMNPHYRTLIRLSFEEVKDLTNNFSDPVSPNVFKGVLPNHTMVVAKVLNDVVVTEREFRLVVSTLGGTHHRNLVQLKGFCFEPKHKILIYEYVANGSLDQWLFNTGEDQNKASWQEKLEISVGVARAIAYLHAECRQCIAHGNLKLENILLDEKLTAKVTNFGIKSLWGNKTTSSETLPERDVYMFGEMLLQIITGKKGDIEETRYSVLYELCQEGHLSSITDSVHVERGSMQSDLVERAIRIAFWCLQDQPFLRPSMGEVVKVLEGSLHVDKPPVYSAFRAKGSQKAKVETEIVEVAS
ncbi:G-type lectin S-receptor-like serine/threonine-protein kinase SD3-1 isoform X1 [Aristolochia californica]|uniref:G-type lectin S-receptor-like serine/threonine-protein kinase SD3-1 isoform X1 n=1 Tax=Aristolochia californica TaxID=171875 RepID=UPI0035DF869D